MKPLSVRQAADLADCSVASIKNWCASGRLRSERVSYPSGQWAYSIRVADLRRFLKTPKTETRGRPRGSHKK